MVYTVQPLPFKLTGKDYGAFDLHDALQKGFKSYKDFHEAANTPKRLSEALLAQQLTNKINTPKAEHAEESERLARQLQQAQINKANRGPAPVLSNLEKAMQGYARIKQQYGDNSPEAAQAKSYVQRLAQGSNSSVNKIPNSKLAQLLYLKQHPDLIPKVNTGESFIPSIVPNEKNKNTSYKPVDIDQALTSTIINGNKDYKYTGEAKAVLDAQHLREEDPIASAELDKRLARKEVTQTSLDRRRDRLASGLKQGESEVFDPVTKKSIGIKKPYTASEKKALGGRKAFNVLYPDILKATAYYSGSGSIKRFNNDISNFDTDKKSHDRIINYMAAIQELSAGTLKENATLAGPSTNQNINRLYSALNASDLPKTYEELQKQFRLPYKAKIEAGQRFSKNLNKATQASENLPAHHIEYDEEVREGNIFNKKTGKIETVEVSPEDWDEFVKAGGY